MKSAFLNLKELIRHRRRLCFERYYRDYWFVSGVGVFAGGYYFERTVEGYRLDVNPLKEYLKSWDAHRRGDEPFKPFITQHADPHPLFDTSFYLAKYFPNGLKQNPFVHYLRKGWKKGYQPGPFFDPVAYSEWSDWQKSDGNPLTHYTFHGTPACLSPGLYFDIDWYINRNPVLKAVKLAIVEHYKLHGSKGGKSPVPIFDPAYYLSQLDNPAVAESDPIAHYIATADRSNRRPGKWFDPDFYREGCNTEVSRSSALAHYLSVGVFNGQYADVRVQQLKKKPLISIIAPVYNPDPGYLEICIRSVLYQVYPHWELCLADDCSTREGIRELLAEWEKKDSRIKVIYLDKNQGISAATNAAASLADGEYLGFLDNDDELSLDCLYHIAHAINQQEVDLIYTDEDLVGDDGSRLSTFRKPDFNPELLLSHNYITHFVVVAKMLFDQVGGFDSAHDGAQDFDLMLKLSEKTDKIYHIPKSLYHWRAIPTSTSMNHSQKNYAHEAGKHALASALKRRGRGGGVEDGDIKFSYRLSSAPVGKKISVLVRATFLTRQDVEKISGLVHGTSYQNLEFVLVTNNERLTEWLDEIILDTELRQKVIVQCLEQEENINHGLHRATLWSNADFLVFLDSFVTVRESDWLEQLLGPFDTDQTGVVCGRVSYEGADGPSYTIPDIFNESAEYYHGFLNSSTKHMNGLHCRQQVSCCGWGVVMMSREFYHKLGGFDSAKFPNLFAMTDLSLRVSQEGKMIIYTPDVKIERGITIPEDENGCAVSEQALIAEKREFQQKWLHTLQTIDPFYNEGILEDNNIARGEFLAWLSGKTGKEHVI